MLAFLRKMLLFSITAVLMFMLQACVPVVFATGAVAGGTVITDSRTTKTMVVDHDIAYKAQFKLRQNRDLRGKTRIVVSSFNRVLLLVGQVPTEKLRKIAEDTVYSIPKVKRVYNGLEIAESISTSIQAYDSWLTAKVKTALLAEKGLRSAQIKIITEDSVVYMLGIINHRQAQLAATVASKVAGVAKVVKLFEYKD